MLLYIFLPLIISWLFKRFNLKRVYLTYVLAGVIALLLPIGVFIYRIYSENMVDSASAAFDNASILNILGNLFLGLFLTLFFQYVFNKTMGIKKV